MNKNDKDAFWAAVEECLLRFHKITPDMVKNEVSELRLKLEHPPKGIATDVIYHAEPFDVACDIAGNQLDIINHQNEYEAILEKFNW